MSKELKALDWLRAKTIDYKAGSEELHYALILYNLIMNLQRENQELKNSLEQKIKELNEENIQCSKYAIEINDLKEKLEEYKEIGKDINVSTKEMIKNARNR